MFVIPFGALTLNHWFPNTESTVLYIHFCKVMRSEMRETQSG